MKKYIKLFEEFVLEGDPLGSMMGGEDDEKEEDPLEKKKKEKQRAEKKAKEKHEDMIDDNFENIDKLLKKAPDVDEKLGNRIRKAVENQDRVEIHNAFLDLTYLQQDYAEKGDDGKVKSITPIKEILDKLDRSYTSSKMM